MSARSRPLDVAQHEAAHVVVGVALGLTLAKAAVLPLDEPSWLGYAWFPRAAGIPNAITLAAGVAWERMHGRTSPGDLSVLRHYGYVRRRDVNALALAAQAILETRQAAHAAVTRLLLERDLSAADVAAIARGEAPAGDSEKSEDE